MSDEEGFRPTYDTCDNASALCPVEATIYGDYFTTSACALYVAIYSICFIVQMYFGFRSKAWSFAAWLGVGTGFELAGYAARIVLADNPWQYTAFIVQILCLILGPTFIAASVSITFKHLVLWYGPKHSWLRPRLYPWVFVGTDMISIIVQGAGGGLSAGSTDDQARLDLANALLIAGTVFQVVNMAMCGGLMLYFGWRRRQALANGPSRLGSDGIETPTQVSGDDKVETVAARDTATPQEESKVKTFVWAISAAYILIIIRCIYR